MNYLFNYYNKCLNLNINKELIYFNYNNKYFHLNLNKNLNKNLILIKVNFQEKELLVQLKNVKVNLIHNIMQLN